MGNDSGTILVAIDGSQNSKVAASVGARLAGLLHAHLGLIHVLDVPTFSFWVSVEAHMKEEIRAEAEATLGAISEQISKSCQVVPEFYIVEGLPEVEIPRAVSEDPNIVMVVLGSLGIATETKAAQILSRRHIGHLAHKLSEVLTVPVLVVPPDVRPSLMCDAMQQYRAAAE